MMNHVKGGIMGLCVADALGVPVEFRSWEDLKNNPVTGFRTYGTHHQPAGTWSDDTSMTLCLADSLIHGVDYMDIMTRHSQWLDEEAYNPHGKVFDIGIGTRNAIHRFRSGTPPLACGGSDIKDNGNGSLMRILPLTFHIHAYGGMDESNEQEIMTVIHQVSSLTHRHKRSLIGCGIYCSIALELLKGADLKEGIGAGIRRAFIYYRNLMGYAEDLEMYGALENTEFSEAPESTIRSTGYVVDTLEAALWCLLKTDGYRDCVLKAVNLGDDTDTVAAVAGGLAGIYYGYGSIPEEWLSEVVRRDYVEDICLQLGNALDLIRGQQEV